MSQKQLQHKIFYEPLKISNEDKNVLTDAFTRLKIIKNKIRETKESMDIDNDIRINDENKMDTS